MGGWEGGWVRYTFIFSPLVLQRITTNSTAVVMRPSRVRVVAVVVSGDMETTERFNQMQIMLIVAEAITKRLYY